MFSLEHQAIERGLNLQFAGYLICLDSMFNPQRMEQLLGRLRRIGSSHNQVMFIRLVSTGTVEEKLESLLSTRAAISDYVLDEESELFDKLSTAELMALLEA